MKSRILNIFLGMEVMAGKFALSVTQIRKKPYDFLDQRKMDFDQDYDEFKRQISELHVGFRVYINAHSNFLLSIISCSLHTDSGAKVACAVHWCINMVASAPVLSTGSISLETRASQSLFQADQAGRTCRHGVPSNSNWLCLIHLGVDGIDVCKIRLGW